MTLRQIIPAFRHGAPNGGSNGVLVRIFAAAAVSCYYWYRLPALFGFGPYPGDGMLVDLRGTLPEWLPIASRILTTSVFVWWMVLRTEVRRTWSIRLPYAQETTA